MREGSEDFGGTHLPLRPRQSGQKGVLSCPQSHETFYAASGREGFIISKVWCHFPRICPLPKCMNKNSAFLDN